MEESESNYSIWIITVIVVIPVIAFIVFGCLFICIRRICRTNNKLKSNVGDKESQIGNFFFPKILVVCTFTDAKLFGIISFMMT